MLRRRGDELQPGAPKGCRGELYLRASLAFLIRVILRRAGRTRTCERTAVGRYRPAQPMLRAPQNTGRGTVHIAFI